LALAFGIPPGELGRRLTSAELTELQAYAELRPFGEYAADFRAAKIAQAFAGGCPLDFMPFVKALEEVPQDEPAADITAKLHALAAAFKG
jgi:hypothetical protein